MERIRSPLRSHRRPGFWPGVRSEMGGNANVGQIATLNSNFTRVYGCLWCIELVGLNINHVITGQPPCGTIGNMMNRCGWCSLFSELEAVGQASWKSPSPLSRLSPSSWNSVVPRQRQHHTIRCPLDAAVGKLNAAKDFLDTSGGYLIFRLWFLGQIITSCHLSHMQWPGWSLSLNARNVGMSQTMSKCEIRKPQRLVKFGVAAPLSLGYCMLSARVLHFPTFYSTSCPNSVDDVLQLLGYVPIFPLISPCAIFYSRFSSWIINPSCCLNQVRTPLLLYSRVSPLILQAPSPSVTDQLHDTGCAGME